MRLDAYISQKKEARSRTHAQSLIESGEVFVNGIVNNKKAYEVKEEDEIYVAKSKHFVSRGAEKLIGELFCVFKDDDGVRHALSGANCLDVGSSTGGFSETLLYYGANHVDAVDVGTSQFSSVLLERESSRINLSEQTDIRNFVASSTYDYIVCDVSFISITNIAAALGKLGVGGVTKYVILFKPQFEVGSGNTKKGIVKNFDIVVNVMGEVEAVLKSNDIIIDREDKCVIEGADGNQEYFLFGYKI